MFRHSRCAFAFILLTFGATAGFFLNSAVRPLQAEPKLPPPIPKELTSYREVVKKVLPAVVNIESKSRVRRPLRLRDDPKDKSIELGTGTGMIVDAKGIILTNYHVVEGADFVEVKLTDGRKFVSQDIVGDKKTDLAIVRIQASAPLPFLPLGDSNEMEVGDHVLAVGAPFGLTGSVTHGIVSGKSRNLKLNVYEDFVQTDAAINPGNSGGPLVNLEGQVIGINSAIKSRSGGFQGVGLAISSNLAKVVMGQLLKDGVVRRGYLGVQIRDIDAEMAEKLQVKEKLGVLVTKVFADTPGAKGGLKVGDILITIGGKPVREGTELQKVVSSLPLGQSVEVVLIRAGATITAKLVIEEQPGDYGLSGAKGEE